MAKGPHESSDPHHFSPRAHHTIPKAGHMGHMVSEQPPERQHHGHEEHQTAMPVRVPAQPIHSGPAADSTDIEMQGNNAYAKGGKVHEAPHNESQENPVEEAHETREQESAESLKEAKPPFGRHKK